MGARNPLIRERANIETRYLKQKDWRGQIEKIFEFVRDKIRYQRDIHGVETLHFPEIILEQGQGDCDDKVILLGALLKSIGYPVKLIAVNFEHRPEHVYTHVFLEVKLGNRWIALDASEPVPVGWRPPRIRNVIPKNV